MGTVIEPIFSAFELFSSAFNQFFMIEMVQFGNDRSGRSISARAKMVNTVESDAVYGVRGNFGVIIH